MCIRDRCQKRHGILRLAKEVANAEEARKRAMGAVDCGHAGKARVEIAGHVARDQDLRHLLSQRLGEGEGQMRQRSSEIID